MLLEEREKWRQMLAVEREKYERMFEEKVRLFQKWLTEGKETGFPDEQPPMY